MRKRMSRKAFFGTLGTAGLGLGLVVSTLGDAPLAFAQDNGDQATAAREDFDPQALRLRFYEEFTTALAGQLNLASVDGVDPAIRAAWTTVVDGLQSDGLITAGQATAVKSLIASSEVPVGPGPMFGRGLGVGIRGMHGGPGGPGGPGLPEAGEQIAVEIEDTVIGNRRAIAERFYPDFTAALATELGAAGADEVDGAIRLAMISVIDTLAGDDTLPVGPVEFLKAMVATADAPLGPGLGFGPPTFAIMVGMHGDGLGPMFGGRGSDGHGLFGPSDGEDGKRGSGENEPAEEEDASA